MKQQEQTREDFAIKRIEAIEDVSTKLLYEITSHYYDYKERPVVRIDFETRSSDKSVDDALESFIYKGILKTFIKADQVSLTKKPDAPKDCSLILDITKDAVEKIHFKATLYRPDRTRLIEKSYSYKKSTFDLSGFEPSESKPTHVTNERKKQAHRTGKYGNAHLLVMGEPTGKFLVDDLNSYKCYEITIYRLTDHEFAEHRSCLFPTRLSCEINGKTYEAAGDKIIFNETITPGRVKLTAWFLESYWDASDCKQTIGKRHQKSFYVDIKRNDNIKVYIGYVHTDEKSSIFASVFREVTVMKNGKKIKQFKETKLR